LGSKKTSSTRAAGLDNDVSMDTDSGDESDGRNALRGVEVREEPAVACCGPGNVSMQHFYELTVMVDRSGQKCWEFQCCFCTWYVKTVDKLYGDAHIKLNSTRSFPRTVDGANITFDMEPKLPKLNNLAGHVPECKGAKDDNKKAEPRTNQPKTEC